MPRYVIESPGALRIPVDDDIGACSCAVSSQSSLRDEVTWLHSYVSLDRSRTFCVCDAPTLEAIRREAGRNGLPIVRVTQVHLLDS